MSVSLTLNILPKDARLQPASSHSTRMFVDALRLKDVLQQANGAATLSTLDQVTNICQHMLSHKPDYTEESVPVRVFSSQSVQFGTQAAAEIMAEFRRLVSDGRMRLDQGTSSLDALVTTPMQAYDAGLSMYPRSTFQRVFNVTLNSDDGMVGTVLSYTRVADTLAWRKSVAETRMRLLTATKEAIGKLQDRFQRTGACDVVDLMDMELTNLRAWDDALMLALVLSESFFLSFSWS